MIKSIRIDGFRHFENFTLNFHYPYTLLCGLNGTGKTAVIEILSRLQQFILNKILVNIVCQAPDIPAWKGLESGLCISEFCFEIKTGEVNYSYSLQIVTNLKTYQSHIEREVLLVNNQSIFENSNGHATLHSDDGQTHKYPTPLELTGLTLAAQSSNKIRAFLQTVKGGIFSLSINAHHKNIPFLSFPQNNSTIHLQEDIEPILNFDASNFFAWYSFLLKKETSVIAEAFKEIVNFIPGFKQFILRSDGAARDILADISAAKKYQLLFDSLSHGQKVLSILHLVVRVAPENAIIAIDELENFLAPTELQPLYNAFQDAYEEKNIQFILISHHPQTLNWFAKYAIVLSIKGNPPRLEASDYNEDMSIVEFLSESAAANEL